MFKPLSVAPLADPSFDPGESQILDADTGYVSTVSNRAFALAAVEAINAMDAIEKAKPDLIDEGWEWAIVEVFGHRRHVGRCREEERFGQKMCRVDEAEVQADGEPKYTTHYYGGASIFSYTITTEDVVLRRSARRPTPALPYRGESTAQDGDDVEF